MSTDVNGSYDTHSSGKLARMDAKHPESSEVGECREKLHLNTKVQIFYCQLFNLFKKKIIQEIKFRSTDWS